jgi:phosphoglycolate phosphatase
MSLTTLDDNMNVLLDLDGTLIDPKPGFVASINHALTSLGWDALPEAEVASHIGPPLEQILLALIGPGRADHVASAVGLYRERYSAHGIFECSVYDGIPDMLQRICRAGFRLFLATSKPRTFAVRILGHFELTPLFSGVYGSELDGRNADKRHLLGHLLSQERIEPNSATMVGDRAQDIAAAKANSLRSVGVLWGYGSRRELESAGADAIIATPPQLEQDLSSTLKFHFGEARNETVC